MWKGRLTKGLYWHFHSVQLHMQTLHRNTSRNTVSPSQERASLKTIQRLSCDYKFLKLQKKNENTCLWKLMFWRYPICLPSLRNPFASTEKGATSLRAQFSWDTQLMGLNGFQNALWPSPHGWHHRTGPTYSVHLERFHTAHSWFVKTRLIVFASLPVENPEAPLHSFHNKQSSVRNQTTGLLTCFQY